MWYNISDILNKAPGYKESVLFAEDGYTLLNEPTEAAEKKPEDKEEVDLNIKINLEEVVDSNAHLVGKCILQLLHLLHLEWGLRF